MAGRVRVCAPSSRVSPFWAGIDVSSGGDSQGVPKALIDLCIQFTEWTNCLA